MSSTESLRRDHALIEKLLRALTVTAELLESGRPVPASILNQSIEFTNNFMLVCHHSKEEESLFPVLEQHGMPREGGPIARMIFEHGVSKELAAKLDQSATRYLKTGEFRELVINIRNYVDHVSSHLMKENLRLFMMADMILKANSGEVTQNLEEKEKTRLAELGKTRLHYENLVEGVSEGLAR